MCGGAPVSLVRMVTARAVGGSRPARSAPFGQALHAGAEDVRPDKSVQGEIRDAEGAQHPGGPVDGGGDVGHLEIGEHVVAVVDERLNDPRPGRAVQLQAYLGHAEPRAELTGQPGGGDGCRRRRGPAPGGCAPTGGTGRVRVIALVLSNRQLSIFRGRRTRRPVRRAREPAPADRRRSRCPPGRRWHRPTSSSAAAAPVATPPTPTIGILGKDGPAFVHRPHRDRMDGRS